VVSGVLPLPPGSGGPPGGMATTAEGSSSGRRQRVDADSDAEDPGSMQRTKRRVDEGAEVGDLARDGAWRRAAKRLLGTWAEATDSGNGESSPRWVDVADPMEGVKRARSTLAIGGSPEADPPVAVLEEAAQARQSARPGLDRDKGSPAPADRDIGAAAAWCQADLAGASGSQLG